jgi:hypothetical protein
MAKYNKSNSKSETRNPKEVRNQKLENRYGFPETCFRKKRSGILQFIFILVSLFVSVSAFAAVGCDLNDPDRDVHRLFPQSTGYKTVYFSLKDKGGKTLLAEIEKRLGDNFKGLYETVDVPYTLYEIIKGTATIGYIHGVNQKGHYGGIQVFLSLDTRGMIASFYVQKLTSRDAKAFRAADFGAQFNGLSLKDFRGYHVATHAIDSESKVGSIKNPAPQAADDFYAILRAVKKNLILLDEFVYSDKH